MEGLDEKRGFRWLARWCLFKAHLLVSGLFMAVLAGQGLIEERYPKATWYWLVIIPFGFWYLWAEWPGRWAESLDDELKGFPSIGAIAMLLWIPCFFLLYWQRAHAWAVVAVGLVSAVAVGTMVKSRYNSYAITLIGWMLAVPTVFRFKWPNEQRFMLVLVLGGLVTALQGSVSFVRALRIVRRTTVLSRTGGC